MKAKTLTGLFVWALPFALSGCTTEPANWNWFQLQPQGQAGAQPPSKTAEDGRQPSAERDQQVASLTGQSPEAGPSVEPVDPRVQSFINRLEGFDRQAAVEPQPNEVLTPRESQRAVPDTPPSRRPAPDRREPSPPRSATPMQSYANGPVDLGSADLTMPDRSIVETTSETIPARPKILGVAVEADASGASSYASDRTHAANAPLSATQQERKSAEDYLNHLKQMAVKAPHDTNLQWRIQLQERALGKIDSAPSSDLPDDQRRLMTQSLEVIDHLERAAADPNRAADQALQSINNLRSELQGFAGLRVPTVQLCTRVTAFGVYDILHETELTPFRPNRVIVYSEVENFQSRQEEPDRWVAQLSCQLELLTTDGQSVWQHEEPTIEDVSRRCRSDFFLAQLVTLPATLAPGNYVLKVTIEDLLAQKTTQGTLAFTLGGGTVLSKNN